jgi:NADH-quinone oxidoreductase subunit B
VSPARTTSSTIRRVGTEGASRRLRDGNRERRPRPRARRARRQLHHGEARGPRQWSRSRSSWPASFGLACCAIEMMATGAAHYDISRFGMEVFRASPRQADIMIVAGPVSQKMAPGAAPGLRPDDGAEVGHLRWASARAAAGCSTTTRSCRASTRSCPVDVYAPGCPAHARDADPRDRDAAQLIEDGEITAGARTAVREPTSTSRRTLPPHEPVPVLLGTR